MTARWLVLLSFILYPATSAFALHLGELADLGEATGRNTSPEVRLTTLSDGRIVAAWTSPGPEDLSAARARILDADGQADGNDLFCGPPDAEPASFRARLAPLGDGFVLGCDVILKDSSPRLITRLRRFSGDGTAAGETIELDRSFLTQLDRLVSSSDTSFVATVLECDEACRTVSRIIGDNGERLGKLREPISGFRRLEPLAGGNYLAVRFGKTSENGNATLFVRVFDGSGERMGPKRRLARVPLSATAMQTVKGSDGRIAVKWDTSGDSGEPTLTHVVLLDETGEQIGDEHVVPNLPIDGNSTSALYALPLPSGFALLSRYGSFTFAQAYSEAGLPVGNRTELDAGAVLLEDVAFLETEQAYVIGGARHSWPNPPRATLLRLDL